MKKAYWTLTRCNCGGIIQHNKVNNNLYVHKFVKEHNHTLTLHKHKEFLRSNMWISKVDKAIIDSMVSYGLKPCHIMGLTIGYLGDNERVDFHSKDMYNYICKVRNSVIIDGDANKIFNCLKGLVENNLLSYLRCTMDDKGHLKHTCFGVMVY